MSQLDDGLRQAIVNLLLAAAALATVFIKNLIRRQRRRKVISRPNVHRRSRRTLTKGARPPQTLIGVTATPDASTVSLTFASAVTVNGPIPLTVESRTFVSQEVTSPTETIVTMNGAVTGMDFALAADVPQIRGMNGEGQAGTAGTFP